jgi:mycoredoxin
MPEKILVYGHPGCPAVPPVTAMLAQAKVAYDYVNIRQQPQAAAQVRTINNGNENVPTLVFPDGTTLTEPSAGELKRKLEALGYRVGPLAWLLGNSWLIITGLITLFALLRFLEIF